MFKRHRTKDLSAYYHGELSIEESRRVAEHLRSCERCRKEFEEIKFGIYLAEQLPRVSAPESMWSEIEVLLEGQFHKAASQPKHTRFALGPHRLAALAVALLLVLGIGAAWYYTHRAKPAWEVVRLEGAPKVGSGRMGEAGRLAVGEWLETDSASRAKISVGKIGQVEIEPNTRVRLVQARLTEHRLALARGILHATIWAPPRLFFVETPSAVAVDLGCTYTLEVDDVGVGLLRVTTGWVAFEMNGRESFVPAGALCETRPGIGPGTPYFEDASEALRDALSGLDFEKSAPETRAAALSVVLAESRQRDALTLWHLLSRVNDAERARVYDQLSALVPTPKGVTREGVMRGDKRMLDLWWNELGLRDASWWRLWKGPWPSQAR